MSTNKALCKIDRLAHNVQSKGKIYPDEKKKDDTVMGSLSFHFHCVMI